MNFGPLHFGPEILPLVVVIVVGFAGAFWLGPRDHHTPPERLRRLDAVEMWLMIWGLLGIAAAAIAAAARHPPQ